MLLLLLLMERIGTCVRVCVDLNSVLLATVELVMVGDRLPSVIYARVGASSCTVCVCVCDYVM